MVHTPHLFEDLKLGDVGDVEGIKSGQDIDCTGTLKFNIKKLKGGSYEFTKGALIDSIINDVGLKDAKVISTTPWV
jgi:hypothetical protein